MASSKTREVEIKRAGEKAPIPQSIGDSFDVVTPQQFSHNACTTTSAIIFATDTRKTPVVITRGRFDDSYNKEFKESKIHTPQNLNDDTTINTKRTYEPRPLQEKNGVPLVKIITQSVIDSGIAHIHILVNDFKSEITNALRELDTTKINIVQLNEVKKSKLDNYAGHLEISEFSLGQLGCALDACIKDNTDSMLLLRADQVQIEPRHISKICQTAISDKETQIFTSWTEWRLGVPVLIRKAWITNLLETKSAITTPKAKRDITALPIREVVFGEEKLLGPYIYPENHDKFMSQFKNKSMREIIREARAYTKAQCVYNEALAEAEGDTSKYEDLAPQTPSALIKKVCKALEILDNLAATRPKLAKYDSWAKRVREDFPMISSREHEQKLIYLDAAATSQQPYKVIEATKDFACNYNSNIYRGSYASSKLSSAQYSGARKKIATFINTEPWQVAFTSNSTDSCAKVARLWGNANITEGDVIAICITEHHSNMLPWRELAQHKGARIEYFRINITGNIDLDDYKRVLKLSPKLVCVSHISNVLGLLNPIHEMANLAHNVGARIMLDCAQSVPHTKVDTQSLGVDFICMSGHKLYGPTGIGVLWYSKDAAEEMHVEDHGGGTISYVSKSSVYPRTFPYCLELGTPPIEGAIGLGNAIDYLNTLGLNNIEEHSKTISEYAIAALKAIVPACDIWGDVDAEGKCLGLFSFSIYQSSCASIATDLASLGIALRATTHCAIPFVTQTGSIGSIRASFGVYNIKEDADSLAIACMLLAEHYANSECRV